MSMQGGMQGRQYRDIRGDSNELIVKFHNKSGDLLMLSVGIVGRLHSASQ